MYMDFLGYTYTVHAYSVYVYVVAMPLKMLINVFVVGCGTKETGRRDAEEKREV